MVNFTQIFVVAHPDGTRFDLFLTEAKATRFRDSQDYSVGVPVMSVPKGEWFFDPECDTGHGVKFYNPRSK